jgi:hypothetical protein
MRALFFGLILSLSKDEAAKLRQYPRGDALVSPLGPCYE